MKQIFEIELRGKCISATSLQLTLEAEASGFWKPVSARDITPRWTKELPREEGYYAYKVGSCPTVLEVVMTHTLGIYDYGGEFVELKKLVGMWSDRPVIMPED